MTQELDTDVRALLKDRIVDYERLETLLFAMRESAAIDVGRLITALGFAPDAAARTLEELVERGLLAPDGRGFRYAPESPALGAAASRLAQAYQDRRIEVIQVMNEIAMDRARNHAARTFADAFLLGKRKKTDG